eukprot:g6276.t1
MSKGDLRSHLPADDFVRVADVRRDIWTGGFKGLAVGLFGGAMFKPTWAMLLKLGHLPKGTPKPEPRHATMAIIMGGCFFAFIGASTAGKNSVQEISDVLAKHSTPERTPYQRQFQPAGLGKAPSLEHLEEEDRMKREALREYGWDVDKDRAIPVTEMYGGSGGSGRVATSAGGRGVHR